MGVVCICYPSLCTRGYATLWLYVLHRRCSCIHPPYRIVVYRLRPTIAEVVDDDDDDGDGNAGAVSGDVFDADAEECATKR